MREFVFANERHPESGRAVPKPGTGTNVCNSGDEVDEVNEVDEIDELGFVPIFGVLQALSTARASCQFLGFGACSIGARIGAVFFDFILPFY